MNEQVDENSQTVDEDELRPGMEPLTPEEMERFLSRARAQGRSLTSEEQYMLFGPPKEAEPATIKEIAENEIEEMEPANLDAAQILALEKNFFPNLHDIPPPTPLVRGIIFDFDYTLAHLNRPFDDILAEGAHQAEAYMQSTGMKDLPEEFWEKIVEARLFAEEKSEEEVEEHIADDAMSFLLQFFGYPVSKMDPDVLKRAVDIFYAPEMSAWQPAAQAQETLQTLKADGYLLALFANYNCERVFQRMVDYTGFRPFLDMVLASASVEYRKPDTTFFNLALEQWDLLPYEVIVVGDSLKHDIQGGLELGALTVQSLQPTSAQTEYDNAQLAETIKPDATIRNLSELPDIVRQWAIG
ncbi:HAD family hydrolase [Chloroflexi bacterium TSY]|nr:HAD family hydrolase [Chloroflexi bacterium TSY]